MWHDFSRWNLAIGLEEAAGIRGQLVLDIREIPDNIGAVGIFFGPYWVGLDRSGGGGGHIAR